MPNLRSADSHNSLASGWSEPHFQMEDVHIGESEEPPKVGEAGNPEYVTGIKLVINMISIVLACFLVLLDTSVVSTVRRSPLRLVVATTRPG